MSTLKWTTSTRKKKKKQAFQKVRNIPHGKVIFWSRLINTREPCSLPVSTPLVLSAPGSQWGVGAKPTRWPTIVEECSSVGLACSRSLLFSSNSGIAALCWGLQKRVQKTKKPVVETSGTCYGRNLESMRSMWQLSIQPAEGLFLKEEKTKLKRILSTHPFQRKTSLCYY